ncbi:lysophospholipid acyltransferase family protein [Pararhizobium capsulatum]|uniref:lysophospholipid acyltransferase family protein n=1 Tax=Pararhizobium capsulatum TaxID=34014 RepID=UPI0027D8E70F|nr:lysophospholipid acyltransferase family protein [Pararhizobium capsulatum]
MLNWLRIGVCMIILLLVTLLLAPIQVLLLWLDGPLRRSLPRTWHRLACRLIGIRVTVHGTPDRQRPLMLVSNHASWKDILVLGSIADVVFVAKSDVKSWPVFGLLARLQATIFVQREQKRTTGNQVNEIGQRMAAGEVVVLFPEGTTSDGNRLLEIKTSLFGGAAAAVPLSPTGMVHVQPMAIAYTGLHGMPMGRFHRPLAAWPGDIGMLPHLIDVLKEGAVDVDVIYGEQINYTADSNRKLVSREIEKRMRDMLSLKLRGR